MTGAMMLSYLKTAVRSQLRQRIYTAINVTGLAVGMTCGLLIFAFVLHETSYERFNAQHDRVYKVMRGEEPATFPGPVADLIRSLPGVEEVSRLRSGVNRPLISGDRLQAFQGVRAVGPRFFDLLQIPFVRGDRATALETPYSVAISEPMARRYYDDEDPIGRVLRWDTAHDIEVTGVYRLPTNTHFRSEIALSLQTIPVEPGWNYPGFDDWKHWDRFQHYVRLEAGASPERFGRDLADALRAQDQAWLVQEWGDTGPRLQPIRAMHQPPFVGLLSGVGVFVLFIACVNFVSLSTARASERVREVGIRKAVGARRWQLAGQFFFESVLQVIVAAGLAWLLAEVARPAFSAVSGLDLPLTEIVSRGVWLPLLGLLLIAALGAGYPSLVLARLSVVRVSKDASRGGTLGTMIRRRLVEVQLGLAILLVVGTVAVYQQLQLMRTSDLGIAKEQLITFKLGYQGVGERNAAIGAAIAQLPSVAGVARHQTMPFRGFSSLTQDFRLESSEEPTPMTMVDVDDQFVDVMGIDLIAGRSARAGLARGNLEVVVSESAVQALGLATPQEAVGQPVDAGWRGKGIIVGVVSDFHFESLHRAIEPLALATPRYDNRYGDRSWIEAYGNMSVRIRAGALPEALNQLEETWSTMVKGYPFTYEFLDEVFERQHVGEARLSTMLIWFAAFALLVTGLGVFALASFAAQQRTKEIGVRKVLGSTIYEILLLLTQDFGRLFLVGTVVAVPVGYWAVLGWLDRFAFRIDPGVPLFGGAASVVLLVATVAMSHQVFRAARANPVDALRHE